MYVDFCLVDTDLREKDIKEKINEAIKCNVSSITVPYHYLKLLKNVPKNKIDVSSFVDHPLGISSPSSRIQAVQNLINAGVNCIDLTIPQILASNRKYNAIREDIGSIKPICDEKSIKIRYVLEYRIFDHRCLKKICEILDDFDIKYAFPSTGFFIDNLSDNILASVFLHQNSKEINVITTGNAWTEHHYNIVARSGVYGIRTFSSHGIDQLKKYTIMNQKSV